MTLYVMIFILYCSYLCTVSQLFLELLKNSVLPWWNKPYEQQLKEKHKMMCDSLIDLRKKISAINGLERQVRLCTTLHLKIEKLFPTSL